MSWLQALIAAPRSTRVRTDRRTGVHAWTQPLLAGCIIASTTGCAAPRSSVDLEDDRPEPGQVRLLWTQPAAGQVHPRNAPVDLCFSEMLDPASVRDGVVNLSSGNQNHDNGLQFDLVDWRPEHDARRCPGSRLRVFPPQPLAPDTRYRLRVLDRLRDWQGRSLQSEGDPRWHITEDVRVLHVDFETGPENLPAPDAPLPAPPLHFADLFEANAVFDPTNPICSCHRAPGPFDLRDPPRAYAFLRDAVTQNEEPWIRPGYPSYSPFIYKLLRDPHGHALPGVFGEPMPPQRPISPTALAEFARWIEGGALP